MKNELRTQIEEAIGASSNTKQFIEECQKREIYPLPHIQGKRMSGIAYRYKKQRIKGSDLGKRFAWQFLSIALNYNSDSDFDFLLAAKEEEEENMVDTAAVLIPVVVVSLLPVPRSACSTLARFMADIARLRRSSDVCVNGSNFCTAVI